MKNSKEKNNKYRRAVVGTMLDGNLKDCAIDIGSSPIGRGYAFGMTYEQFNKHLIIIGGTGTGKTVTQLRIMSSLMALSLAYPNEPRIRILFVDAKGLNPSTVSETIGMKQKVVRLAEKHGYLRINSFPDQNLDGFSGDPLQVIERLSGLFQHGESEFHHAEATVMLSLAFFAGYTPTSLGELIERVKPGVSEAIYMSLGTEEGLRDAKSCKSFTSTQWNSIYLRLKSLQLRVGTKFDKTTDCFSFRNTECAYISISGTTSPQSAADVATWLLKMVAEIAEYNDGIKTVIFLDEFSAIGDDDRAVNLVAGLVERVRSAGISLIVGTQTTNTLGEKAERMLGTVGTLLTHRNGSPEDIISYAGTEKFFEDTYEINENNQRVKTGGRLQEQFCIAPDEVRNLPIGECFVISEGKWARVGINPIQGL